jgi:hypothetical protein
VRRVIAFADGRSGSVGESRSRVALYRSTLPTPVLQWEVTDRAGRFIGNVDFGCPAQRTVGEFDGRVEYGRSLRGSEDPGEVVFAEKLREDRLRDQDLAVVRWTWADLAHFGPSRTGSAAVSPAPPHHAALRDTTQPLDGLRRDAKGCVVTRKAAGAGGGWAGRGVGGWRGRVGGRFAARDG